MTVKTRKYQEEITAELAGKDSLRQGTKSVVQGSVKRSKSPKHQSGKILTRPGIDKSSSEDKQGPKRKARDKAGLKAGE